MIAQTLRRLPSLPSRLPSTKAPFLVRCCIVWLCCALPLLLGGCGGKNEGLLVLDAQSREALSMPQLRPLALPPRYNLDGGEESLSRPAASLTDKDSLRLSDLAPPKKVRRKNHRDAAFLQRLNLKGRDPNIRRRIAEETRQAVPLSQPLLDAIRQNNPKSKDRALRGYVSCEGQEQEQEQS